MKPRSRVGKPQLVAKASQLAPKKRVMTCVYGAYLLLTGALFLFVQFQDDISSDSTLMSAAGGVAYLFSVVDNTRFCSTLTAQRYVFVGLLIPATHAVMLALVVSTALTIRREGAAAPSSELHSFREGISLVATVAFSALLYWYVFFGLGAARPGMPSSTSFLCMNLGVTWLVFTITAGISIGLLSAVLLTLWSMLWRAIQFVQHNKGD